jgi:hypothetical protein
MRLSRHDPCPERVRLFLTAASQVPVFWRPGGNPRTPLQRAFSGFSSHRAPTTLVIMAPEDDTLVHHLDGTGTSKARNQISSCSGVCERGASGIFQCYKLASFVPSLSSSFKAVCRPPEDRPFFISPPRRCSARVHAYP